MTIEQAQQIHNDIKNIPMDWQIISRYTKNKLKKMMDDISEAIYIFDIHGMKKEADQLAQREYIFVDAYMTK